MKIIEEGLVDWEPLQIGFVPAESFFDPDAVVRDVTQWFETNAAKKRSDCDLRYWKASRTEAGTVEAFAEHLTTKSLRRLIKDVARRHPQLDRVVVGYPIEGGAEAESFDWVCLPASEIECGGIRSMVDAVAISFTCVTLGQFAAFTETAGYVPIPDAIEGEGYVMSHFRLNYGKSPKLPLCGVTYDDALAYCEWAGLRLPTEPELHHFFVSLVTQGRRFPWSGKCWTTTSPEADHFVVRDGPYVLESLEEPLDRYRMVLHRHHYQELETPCFRVARTRTRVSQA